MGVFDKASLALVPDGIKDGKLYSIKPTDGSGDFTFERGSDITATRVNKDGYIEKGRGNFLLQSNQFDTTWALGSGLSLTSGQSGYDGSSDAWVYSDTSTGNSLGQTCSTSGVQTLSIYAKAGTADGIRLRWLGGSGGNSYFNIADSSTEAYSTTNTIQTKKEDVGSGWFRVSLTFNDSVNTIRLYVADGSSTSSTSGSIYIQDAQLEQGLVATDYIETGATTAQAGILEDLPRIDYTGGTPSLLMEPSRTNLIDHSEYFGGYSNTYSTNEVNATISPEGLTNATFFKEDTSTGSHILNKSAIVVAGVYTASVFVKANGRDWIFLNIAPASNYGAYFDLSNGTTGTILSNITSATIEDYGNGWYRCSLTADTATDSLSPRIAMYLALSNNQVSYTGDGTSGVYIFGAQLEAGSYPTSYIPTYGATATRGGENSAFELELASFFNNVGVSGDATFMMETSIVGRSSSYIDLFSQGGSGNNTYSGTTFWLRKEGGGGIANFGDLPDSLTILDSIKILIRKSGTTFNVFVNGTKSTSTQTIDVSATPIKWADHVSTFRNSHAVKQILKFPEALSDTDCITLTT